MALTFTCSFSFFPELESQDTHPVVGPSRSRVSGPLFHVIWDQPDVFRASSALLGANCSHSSHAHLPELMKRGEGGCFQGVSNFKTDKNVRICQHSPWREWPGLDVGARDCRGTYLVYQWSDYRRVLKRNVAYAWQLGQGSPIYHARSACFFSFLSSIRAFAALGLWRMLWWVGNDLPLQMARHHLITH